MTEHTDAARLLERDGELAELSYMLDEACAARGRLVLIEGPSGVGKTRLVEAVRAEAAQRGMRVLSARASELDREFPFGAVRQLFDPLIATADEARRARLLAGAASRAAPLLGAGMQAPEEAAATEDPSLAYFHALYWLLANLTEEAPAALVMDDIHWADASSLRFLQFLLPRIDALPVLVAVATRPPEPGLDRRPIDALATDPLAHSLRPAPLSATAVQDLVTSVFGARADAAFAEACHEATGGNPFLVGELLTELVADDVTPSAASAPLVRELAPPTVARAVLVRLARLGEETSSFARAIAVLGDGIPLQRACALSGLPQERGGELAARLAAADILSGDRPLAFAHPILRSVVYSDIDPTERARMHRRAAALLAEEGLQADSTAAHLLATEPAGDPYVVASLRDAAERALSRGAASTAVACLKRALSEPPSAEQRHLVIFELASAELRLGDPAAAAELFDEAAGMTQDPCSRATRAGEHALALQAVGRHEDAFAVRERAVIEVADVDPSLALALEATLIGTARFDLARLSWAQSRLEHYRGKLAPRTPAEWRLLAVQVHLDAFAADRADPAETLADAAEPALAALTAIDLPRGFASPGFFAAFEVLLLADRVAPAGRAMDQATEAVRRSGSASGFAFTSGWRCLLLARSGALTDAEADARSCADMSLSQGWFSVAPMILGFALEVLVERGELDEAERVLDGCEVAERPADDDLTFDPVVHARARLYAARGDLDSAQADFRSLLRRGARWNTYPTLVPATLVAPELIAENQAEALAVAEQMLSEAYAWGTPRAIGMALHALGLAEGGARGLDLLEEATRVLERSPARLEYARALTDLGAAQRRANRAAAARDPLREALDLADACGAVPLAERARHELRAAGRRPRRARSSGVQALTASERRVAMMAAEGLSNPEIAQALFVTRKTVETHLGNVYRKLDIRSRTRLGPALSDGPRS